MSVRALSAGRPAAVSAPPRRRLVGVNIPGLLFFLACIVLAEILARAGLLTSYVPPPSIIFAALFHGLIDGDISSQVGITLLVYAESLSLAVFLGVTVAILMGTYPFVFNALKMIIEFNRPVPSVAFIPLAILFLGLGSGMRMAVVTHAAFWPILISTLYGVRSIDPLSLDVARNFGVTGFEALRRVTLPSALTSVMTGLRVSASIALVVTITTELVAGNSGVGFYISQMEQANRLPEMYAGIILTGIMGVIINAIFFMLGNRIVFWAPSAHEKTN
jgi:NitT/TauT family transport system permease protein